MPTFYLPFFAANFFLLFFFIAPYLKGVTDRSAGYNQCYCSSKCCRRIKSSRNVDCLPRIFTILFVSKDAFHVIACAFRYSYSSQLCRTSLHHFFVTFNANPFAVSFFCKRGKNICHLHVRLSLNSLVIISFFSKEIKFLVEI